MIKQNYYHLISSLPELFSDEKKPPFTTVEFREELQRELSAADFDLAMLYYLPFDNKNLLNILFKKEAEWDQRSVFTKEELEPVGDRKQFEFAEDIKLPSYMMTFLKQFHGDEGIETYQEAERLLTTEYYNYISEKGNDFVKKFAEHEKIVRNVMIVLSGRKHEFQHEDNIVGDNDITAALKKSRARDFGLSGEVQDIETLAQIFETENIVEREFKLDQYLWNYLDEITFFHYSSIERVIAYIKKLLVAERWFALDKEKGHQFFNNILKELSAGFQLPEEYTTAYGKKK